MSYSEYDTDIEAGLLSDGGIDSDDEVYPEDLFQGDSPQSYDADSDDDLTLEQLANQNAYYYDEEIGEPDDLYEYQSGAEDPGELQGGKRLKHSKYKHRKYKKTLRKSKSNKKKKTRIKKSKSNPKKKSRKSKTINKHKYKHKKSNKKHNYKHKKTNKKRR